MREVTSPALEFSQRLLEWWETNKRDFPWRRTQRPYEILIAEMLLRKTTAQQVENIYERFLKKYPNPLALSKARESALSKFLRPLGMEHRRAVIFIKFAKAVLKDHRGKIPSKLKDLLKLLGVGMYAANAVLSFTYKQNVPIVDTNFIRVVERIFNLRSSKSRAWNDKVIWDFARTLIPNGKSREFNLAVLDFAASICRSRSPSCDAFQFSGICALKSE